MSFNKDHEHLKHGPYTLSTYKDRTPKRTWVYFYFFFFPLVTTFQRPKVPNTPSCQRTMTSLEAKQNPHQTDAYPPATLNVQSQSGGPWSTGLCDCCDDVEICCLTWLCPCITFGRVAEIVDRGSVSCGANCAIYTLIAMVTGCPFIYSCCYRSRIRGQYLLQEDPCHDCLVHWCCETCALCQEYRELKNRGFDMSLGWDGNVARQTRGVTTLPPAVNGGMSR